MCIGLFSSTIQKIVRAYAVTHSSASASSALTISCPGNIFQTIHPTFMKLHMWIYHDERVCHAQGSYNYRIFTFWVIPLLLKFHVEFVFEPYLLYRGGYCHAKWYRDILQYFKIILQYITIYCNISLMNVNNQNKFKICNNYNEILLLLYSGCHSLGLA